MVRFRNCNSVDLLMCVCVASDIESESARLRQSLSADDAAHKQAVAAIRAARTLQWIEALQSQLKEARPSRQFARENAYRVTPCHSCKRHTPSLFKTLVL